MKFLIPIKYSTNLRIFLKKIKFNKSDALLEHNNNT